MIRMTGGAAAACLVASGSKGQSQNGWFAGEVAHLIPTANHERFLIKVSFKTALDRPPVLRARELRVDGVMTDTAGRYWMFDEAGLMPATKYDLQIRAADGRENFLLAKLVSKARG